MNSARFFFALALVVFGCALGLMAGLSVSPVVAALLGVLAPLAAGLVTWKADLTNAATQPPKLAFLALVLGPLSLGLIGGIVAGIHVRTHGSLSPRPLDRVAVWTAAGLSPEKALELVVAEAQNGNGAPSGGSTATASSVLFGAHDSINLVQYQATFQGGDLASILAACQAVGGPWARFGRELNALALSDDQKVAVARALYRAQVETAR